MGNVCHANPGLSIMPTAKDVSHVNCSADKIFDLQESTYWSTTKDTPYPHSVVIDLGSTRTLTGIQYLPRMESEVPWNQRLQGLRKIQGFQLLSRIYNTNRFFRHGLHEKSWIINEEYP